MRLIDWNLAEDRLDDLPWFRTSGGSAADKAFYKLENQIQYFTLGWSDFVWTIFFT